MENEINDTEEIMVSTMCTTYNHEHYISRTLGGFVGQQTSFKTEFIVHDDCSTDRTPEIIQGFARIFPDIIKPIFEKENQYSKHVNVGRLTFEKCKGKYIACCEGDDFWIDPTKLQRQFEYMEEHPECSICGHNTIQYNAETAGLSNYSRYYEEKDLNPEEVLSRKGGTFQTSSFMIRREVLEEYYEDKPGIFTNVGLSDMCIRAFALTKGTVHFMDRTMSVYRRNLPGSWTARHMSQGATEESWRGNIRVMNFFVEYDKYTEGRYHYELINYLWRYVEIMVSRKVARDIEQDLFLRLVSESEEEYGDNLKPYLTMIKERYFIINSDEYWKKLADSINNIPQIIIYGKGDYGHIAFEKLCNCGITPMCFVVSSRQRIGLTEEEIPVYEFGSLDFDKGKTLVVMAVNTNHEIEIGDIDCPNVIYPFSNRR